MNKMYYCKKCHNVVFAEEDYTGRLCFRCEEDNFIPTGISEQEADKMTADGTYGNFLEKLWGLSPQKILLTVQYNPDENICYSEKTNSLVSESGRPLKNPKSNILNWGKIMSDSHKLGKCGELYAQALLESMGYEVCHPFVDNHGIDLIANKSDTERLLVQVKTVKEGNYSFIQKDKFYDVENYVVFYIRVDNYGVPRAFVYPSKVWPKESESEITFTYGGRFTYHPYAEDGQKSKAEYGISGAKKYYMPDDEFCIDTDKIFVCDKEKFDEIIGNNK